MIRRTLEIALNDSDEQAKPFGPPLAQTPPEGKLPERRFEMARSKALPARKAQARDDESLLLRSAESLGRMIGSLQRQLDDMTGRLSTTTATSAPASRSKVRTGHNDPREASPVSVTRKASRENPAARKGHGNGHAAAAASARPRKAAKKTSRAR
jgi:hypothetical protein